MLTAVQGPSRAGRDRAPGTRLFLVPRVSHASASHFPASRSPWEERMHWESRRSGDPPVHHCLTGTCLWQEQRLTSGARVQGQSGSHSAEQLGMTPGARVCPLPSQTLAVLPCAPLSRAGCRDPAAPACLWPRLTAPAGVNTSSPQSLVKPHISAHCPPGSLPGQQPVRRPGWSRPRLPGTDWNVDLLSQWSSSRLCLLSVTYTQMSPASPNRPVPEIKL